MTLEEQVKQILMEHGESFLADDGVDPKVCAEVAAEIVALMAPPKPLERLGTLQVQQAFPRLAELLGRDDVGIAVTEEISTGKCLGAAVIYNEDRMASEGVQTLSAHSGEPVHWSLEKGCPCWSCCGPDDGPYRSYWIQTLAKGDKA